MNTMKHTVSTIVLGCLMLAAATTNALAQRGGDPSVAHHSDVQIAPLGINAPEADFAPAFLRGGEMMVFTSARPGSSNSSGEERLWVSMKRESQWGAPVPLGDALREAEHVGGATLTPDGNFMIFAAYGWSGDAMLRGEGRTDLYSAEKIGGEWRNVRNLGAAVNSSFWDSQPSLSSDGRTLYFASNRPGGEGGADIYISRRSASGWSAPVNLGAVINTSKDDMTPSIAPDDATLFFSSNGHGGVGGFDIFVAAGSESGGERWKSIENIGTPINSSSDEHCFISLPNRRYGYFSSNKSGNLELYKADPNPRPAGALVTVGGRVLDAGSQAPVGASITVTDLGSGETVATYRTDDQTGDYYVILKRGWRYAITAEADGYIFYSDEYSVPLPSSSRDLRKDIPLEPVEGGATRLLVFFDYDRAELKRESGPDLDRALKFLKLNPSATIEIAGHTDSLGSAIYNRKLSQDRADAVKRHFTEGGINPARIAAKGYGEDRPVDDNAQEEGRARNRRVEMRVMRKQP